MLYCTLKKENIGKKRRKGQAAIEYMIVVTTALMFLAPMIIAAQKSINNLNKDISYLKGYEVLSKIKNAGDIVYAQGPPSRLTIFVDVPPLILRGSIENNALAYWIGYPNRMNSTVLVFTNYPVLGKLPITAGMHKLVISAEKINGIEYINVTPIS